MWFIFEYYFLYLVWSIGNNIIYYRLLCLLIWSFFLYKILLRLVLHVCSMLVLYFIAILMWLPLYMILLLVFDTFFFFFNILMSYSFYYLRELHKYDVNIDVNFTTTNFSFSGKITSLYKQFMKCDMNFGIVNEGHEVARFVLGPVLVLGFQLIMF